MSLALHQSSVLKSEQRESCVAKLEPRAVSSFKIELSREPAQHFSFTFLSWVKADLLALQQIKRKRITITQQSSKVVFFSF